jgi:hypothetical protein
MLTLPMLPLGRPLRLLRHDLGHFGALIGLRARGVRTSVNGVKRSQTDCTFAENEVTIMGDGQHRILVSGASVAGLTLACWLRRFGSEVTVVERSAGLRPGGQALDVRGPALEVARRMGVLEEFRKRSTQLRGLSMVDDSGAEIYRTTERTLTGGCWPSGVPGWAGWSRRSSST